MVHGGDPRSLSNALDWDTVWDPDSLGARLVAYDKPGQGLSYDAATGPDAMTGPALSRHLEALVEQLADAGPVVLMGHSRGALPVADVALRRADLVDAVVLVSSNTLAPTSPQTPASFYPRAYADPPSVPTVEYVVREPMWNSYSSEHLDKPFIEGRMLAARHADWWGDRERRTAWHDETILPSLRELRNDVLQRIESDGFAMRVLQLWGHDDVSAPVQLGTALYEMLTRHTEQCTSVVLNRARHYVYRDQAATTRALLRAFLENPR